MQESLTLFKIALQIEAKACTFYKKAAELTENDESRMLFLQLSSEEDDHTRHIIENAKNLPFLKDFDVAGYIKELEADMESTVSVDELQTLQTGDMKAVLELAIFIEGNALKNYNKLAEHTEDKETKDLCAKLAEEEKEHLNSITSMLESLDMDEEDRPAL